MLVPVELTLDQEVPVTAIPPEAHWSENYCFLGYDYVANIGVYLHIGRWAHEQTIWREQIYVWLPDGSSLSQRALGRGDCSRGPQGALLQFHCEQPGRHWTLDYTGPAIATSAEVMLAGPVPDAVPQKLIAHIDFTALGPPMMYEIVDNSTIGRWHYEQEMALNGSISVNGITHQLHGHGWRDHTRGPRYLPKLRGHVNTNGRFADGTFFSCFVLWEERDGEERCIVSEARFIREGRFIPATVIDCKRLATPADCHQEVRLTLEAEGRRYEFAGLPLNLVVISNSARFDFIYGISAQTAPLASFLQPIRYRCGDAIVEGHCERSIWLA